MSLITVEDILEEYVKRGRGTVKPGADRLQRLFGGTIPQPFHVVLVAGTNGKGSTAWCLSHALQTQNVKVGLYTSPHLLNPTERIRVNNKPISQQNLLKNLHKAHSLAEQNLQDASFFEVFTAAAILAFQETVDIAIFEVGLGGRLDSTNSLSPDISVITALGFDHAEFLGTDPKGIGFEKGCISRKAKPCIFLKPKDNGFNEGLDKAFALTGCESMEVLPQALTDVQEVVLQTRNLWVKSSTQALALAFKVSQILFPKFSQQDKRVTLKGLEANPWPGRLQQVTWNGKSIIFDGGHNLCGLKYCANALQSHIDLSQVKVITGVFADKKWEDMISFLKHTYSHVSVCELAAERSIAKKDSPELSIHPLKETLEQQLATLLPCETLLLTGSLSLVGEAMEILGIEL